MTIQIIKKQMVLILKRQGVIKGSVAREESKKRSDIDVCIISDKFSKNKDHYETYLWKRVLEVDHHIKPIDYCPKDFIINIGPLVNEIKKHEIIIKSKV